MQVTWNIFHSRVHFPICNTADLNTFSPLSVNFCAEGSQWSFIALSYEVWHFWHYLMCKSNCISQRLCLNSYHFKPMPWEYCIQFPHYFQPCRLYQELLLVHYNHKMKVVTFYKGQVYSQHLANFILQLGWTVSALFRALLLLGCSTCSLALPSWVQEHRDNTKTFNKN